MQPLGPGLVGAQRVGSEQIQPDGIGRHLGQPAGFAGATGAEQKVAARKAVVNAYRLGPHQLAGRRWW
jgi:hypothetical protein